MKLKRLGKWIGIVLILMLTLTACVEGNKNAGYITPEMLQETPETLPETGADGQATETPTRTATSEPQSTATAEPTATATPLATNTPTVQPTADGVTPTQESSPTAGWPLQASQLINAPLVDAEGESVGSIQNVVLNLRNGSTPYILADMGGLLDVSGDTTPLPWQALVISDTATTDDGPTFRLLVNPADLEQAPRLRAGDEVDLSQDGWDAEFQAYWLSLLTETDPLTATLPMTATEGMTITLPVTGTPPVPPVVGMDLVELADRLIGYSIENADGNTLAEVEDVLLASDTGQIEYLIVSTGGLLGVGEKWVPVPVEALQLSSEAGVLQLNIAEEGIMNAPNFDLAQLPELAPDQWDANIRLYWDDFWGHN